MKKTIKTRLSAGTILATMLVTLPAGATSLLIPQATTAMAQPSGNAETGEANAQKTPAPDTVDLAALYYYARNGEAERVEAETRRLELKFPGFMPPADLYAPDTGDHVDENDDDSHNGAGMPPGTLESFQCAEHHHHTGFRRSEN